MSKEEKIGNVWPAFLATFATWIIVAYQVYILWEPSNGYPYLLSIALLCAAVSTFLTGVTLSNISATRKIREFRLELQRKFGK